MAEEHKAKFSSLFAALMILVAAMPFLRAGAIGGALLQVLFTVVLISGLYAAVDDSKRVRIITWAVAVPALGFSWAGRVFSNLTLSGVGGLLLAAFLTITAVEILQYIVRARRVTSQVVFGSVSVYLMIGIVGAFLFSALELWAPGSLRLPGMEGAAVHDPAVFSALSYFSFVTLTTLGYGDITPVSPFARSMATMLAVTGQLYLVVLVARVVGLHIAQSTKSTE
jgi:hypothetical protein